MNIWKWNHEEQIKEEIHFIYSINANIKISGGVISSMVTRRLGVPVFLMIG